MNTKTEREDFDSSKAPCDVCGQISDDSAFRVEVTASKEALADLLGISASSEASVDVSQWKLEEVGLADPMLAAYRLFKATKEDRDRLLLGEQAAGAEIDRLREAAEADRIHREALVFDRDSARRVAEIRLTQLGRIEAIVAEGDMADWEMRRAILDVLRGRS